MQLLPWRYWACFLFCWLLPLQHTGFAASQNVVFFLVDDLGWADVGCFGSQFYETPNIDRLAASGTKFTQAYAACPVCSPTRASILTGRHPVRVDITDWIPGRATSSVPGAKFAHIRDRDNLALEETTIAEVLRTRGYQTFFAGKWHLGGKGYWPTDQGFDVNVGGNDKGSPPGGYYSPWKNPTLKAKSNTEEYLTERLTDEAVDFLSNRQRDKPFLLYLSYYNVHTPIQAYKQRIDHFREKQADLPAAPNAISERDGVTRPRQDNAKLASMVAAVDQSVGRILDELDRRNLSQDTTIIFFSDNGGLSTLPGRPGPTSNLPLRAGKGWLYEGGIREPAILRIPGVTQPGTVCDSPIVSMDFFPTMLAVADAPPMPDLHVDGTNIIPRLQTDKSAGRTLYWHYPHYHGSAWKPGAALRKGDWKLIEFYHYGTWELYNLKTDPGEQTNLASTFPERCDALRTELRAWQQTTNARMPQRLGD